MNYTKYFASCLEDLRQAGNYRVFADLERSARSFPRALHHRDGETREITVWCSNDYLGMGVCPEVIEAMKVVADLCGTGAGGTRNISGTSHYHVLLERELASWQRKDEALLFTSGYVANMTVLMTLGARVPGMTIFSDALNHNSLIEGIRHSRAAKEIWRHNDTDHLHQVLKAHDRNAPKLIVFESVYSMDGDIAPLEKIIDIATHHKAMTFLDEVHAVGMYGAEGAGIAEREGVRDRIDIIQGTLGKAVGAIGGFIAADRLTVDFIRSFGAGFIFTTSLPPAVAAAAYTSVRYLRSHPELRDRQQERAATLKQRLLEEGIPVMPSVSHIVPVLVGDAVLCKRASDALLAYHDIYVQPINYPTVPRGEERLRLTPTPLHSDNDMDKLCLAFVDVWNRLGLDLAKAAA